MAKLNLLHVVGSPTDQFYCDLSRLYGEGCLAAIADSNRYAHTIAYLTPDGSWRFPVSLNDEDIAQAKPLTLAGAISFLQQQPIDLALPQLFCVAGMTDYRALLDLLKIPYLGNLPGLMAIAADKAKTKAIVATAGVPVPAGELLHKADWQAGKRPAIELPIIVKPTKTDNSIGLGLVQNAADYEAALSEAFAHDDEVIVERFIPLGREVRCGIIECEGELVCLPLEEYRMDAETQPVRAHANKLTSDNQGKLGYAAKDETQCWIVSPDDPGNDAVTQRVWQAAKQCHRALGCRHYSLFDFRIDPQGQPWFLEAGLYCSFSPKSVLSAMMQASGLELEAFFKQMVREALG